MLHQFMLWVLTHVRICMTLGRSIWFRGHSCIDFRPPLIPVTPQLRGYLIFLYCLVYTTDIVTQGSNLVASECVWVITYVVSYRPCSDARLCPQPYGFTKMFNLEVAACVAAVRFRGRCWMTDYSHLCEPV